MSEQEDKENDSSDNRNNRGQIIRAEFSGPLPPPVILEQYNNIVPGAAERILKMAEDQSAHRRDLESRVIKSDIFNSKLGLIFGFLIGIVAIVAGAFIAFKGQETAGGVISISGIAALAGVFVYGSKQRSKERQEKE